MSNIKEVLLDDYYDFPVFKIVKKTGSKIDLHEFSNPKIGKIYRNPIINVISSRTVTIIKIIGIEKEMVPHFEYAYPPVIKRLHIEESIVYVKV